MKIINNINRILTIAFGILLLIICMGCGDSSKPTEKQQGYKIVTDKQGKTVKLPQAPKRVVSLSVSTDEMLLELLPTEHIAGLTKSIDRREISNVQEKAKKVKQRIDPNSAESILKLQPDLVIVPDFIRPEVINTLRDVGIAVYVYHKPNSFNEIKATIKEIGDLLNKDSSVLISYMEKKEAFLRDKLGKIPSKDKKRAVYLMANGVYSNPSSTYQDICFHAGVLDASMELKLGKKAFLSKEQLVKLDPEIIIITDFNWDGKTETDKKIKAILEDPAYSGIKAVRNKQIVAIPGAHIYSLSHYVIDASVDLAKAIYPDCFK